MKEGKENPADAVICRTDGSFHDYSEPYKIRS